MDRLSWSVRKESGKKSKDGGRKKYPSGKLLGGFLCVYEKSVSDISRG